MYPPISPPSFSYGDGGVCDGVVWCGVVWCGVVWCDVTPCDGVCWMIVVGGVEYSFCLSTHLFDTVHICCILGFVVRYYVSLYFF